MCLPERIEGFSSWGEAKNRGVHREQRTHRRTTHGVASQGPGHAVSREPFRPHRATSGSTHPGIPDVRIRSPVTGRPVKVAPPDWENADAVTEPRRCPEPCQPPVGGSSPGPVPVARRDVRAPHDPYAQRMNRCPPLLAANRVF